MKLLNWKPILFYPSIIFLFFFSCDQSSSTPIPDKNPFPVEQTYSMSEIRYNFQADVTYISTEQDTLHLWFIDDQSDRLVTLTFPLSALPGAYTMNGRSVRAVMQKDLTKGGHPKNISGGKLFIRQHCADERHIRGSFLLEDSGMDITRGQFNLSYEQGL